MESEVVQAAELLEQWRKRSPIEVTDALKLLGSNVAFQTGLVSGVLVFVCIFLLSFGFDAFNSFCTLFFRRFDPMPLKHCRAHPMKSSVSTSSNLSKRSSTKKMSVVECRVETMWRKRWRLLLLLFLLSDSHET